MNSNISCLCIEQCDSEFHIQELEENRFSIEKHLRFVVNPTNVDKQKTRESSKFS
jgi:hypothetical protein